jgi:hypothetical protein
MDGYILPNHLLEMEGGTFVPLSSMVVFQVSLLKPLSSVVLMD